MIAALASGPGVAPRAVERSSTTADRGSIASAGAPKKGEAMSEWVRVATFEADSDAVESMVREISSAEGPPPGIPAKSIMVLADRENSRARIVVRFDSEENLRTGSATLDAMEPPTDANMRRISIEKFEIVLERQAP
jgi:hypothetical protein